LGVRLDGDAMDVVDSQGEHVTDDTFLLLFNAHHETVPFTLPNGQTDARWAVVFDTHRPHLAENHETHRAHSALPLEGRSLALLRRLL
jgi:glycogen operon protein